MMIRSEKQIKITSGYTFLVCEFYSFEMIFLVDEINHNFVPNFVLFTLIITKYFGDSGVTLKA